MDYTAHTLKNIINVIPNGVSGMTVLRKISNRSELY